MKHFICEEIIEEGGYMWSCTGGNWCLEVCDPPGCSKNYKLASPHLLLSFNAMKQLMYNNRGLLNNTNNIHHHRPDDLRYYYGQNKKNFNQPFLITSTFYISATMNKNLSCNYKILEGHKPIMWCSHLLENMIWTIYLIPLTPLTLCTCSLNEWSRQRK